MRLSKKAVNQNKFFYSDFNVINAVALYLKKIKKDNFSFFPDFIKLVSFFSFFFNYSCYYFFNRYKFKNYCKKFHCITNYKFYKLEDVVLYLIGFEFFSVNKLINSIISRIVTNYYSSDIFSRILR